MNGRTPENRNHGERKRNNAQEDRKNGPKHRKKTNIAADALRNAPQLNKEEKGGLEGRKRLEKNDYRRTWVKQRD